MLVSYHALSFYDYKTVIDIQGKKSAFFLHKNAFFENYKTLPLYFSIYIQVKKNHTERNFDLIKNNKERIHFTKNTRTSLNKDYEFYFI